MRRLREIFLFFRSVTYLIFVFLVLLLFILRLLSAKTEAPIGKSVEITGKVREEPRLIGQSQYLKIAEVQIRANHFPEYHFGDILKVQGIIEEGARINFPQIEKVGEANGLIPSLFDLRRNLIGKAEELWPEPQSSLISGIVLGNNSLEREFYEDLKKTGTLHIVVVSGQNVTILAGFIFLLVPLFSRRFIVVLIIACVFLYTVLSGLQPPAIRAAIMGSLAYGASLFGREKLSLWGLVVSAFAMLFVSPRLVSDISFQLSFFATLGILLLSPFAAKAGFLPRFFKENLLVTLAAWIFTAPLLSYYFAQFTPITPFSNLFILPFVPALMILGAASLILGSIFYPAGQALAYFSQIPASLVTIFIERISLFPFATIPFSVPVGAVLLYYFFLFSLVLWFSKKLLFVTK